MLGKKEIFKRKGKSWGKRRKYERKNGETMKTLEGENGLEETGIWRKTPENYKEWNEN